MPNITKPHMNRDTGPDEKRKAGRWLTELRKAKGMTQLEVGNALGVRDTYISSIERGGSAISPERYAEYAKLFGIESAEFGKRLLSHYNPWLYAMIFGGGNLAA